jgi:MoaA/NifB/PqqE/SkfB family radical SAM enzyme
MRISSLIKKVTPKWSILLAKQLIRNYNYLLTKKYFTNEISNINALEFHLTERCNYKCEYCSGGYSPKSRNADDKTVNNFITLISKLKEGATIKLIGGEPTFHPRFLEIAQAIIQHKHNLHIGTNFSPSNGLFKKLIDATVRNDQINLLVSLHLSQIESVEGYIEKAVSIKEYAKGRVFIQISSVVTDENIVLLKEINKKLTSHNIPMMFQRLKVNSKTGFFDYTPETENYLQENFPDRIGAKIEGLNTFGLMCRTGYNFIRISLDGEVRRCYNFQAKLYGLGNLNKTWRPLKCIMPCLGKRCTCLLPVAWDLISFGNYNKELAKRIR